MSLSPEPQPAALAASDAADRTRLGVCLTWDGADFVVVAPRAAAVDLCLIDTDDAGDVIAERRVGLHGPRLGVWSAHVPGVRAGQRYGYRVHGPWDPSEGMLFNPRKLLLDPYARAIDGAPQLGPELYAHAVEEDLSPTFVPFVPSELDSAGHVALGVVTGEQFAVVPGPKVPDGRTVVYETHVKGFTRTMPGVPPELRGTYAGLAHPASIEHLRSLGVTTVELLPIHAAFSEAFLLQRGRTNYWGYSTLSYFAPEPSYATATAQAAGPQAVLDELRGMVSLLHEAGLEVIMDVVYNHTCESGADGPTLSLRGLDNREYYLHAPHQPAQYIDVTGTGNTVDFRSTRAVQLVLDSLRYWAGDVGVDGFRFDLAVTLGRDASEFHPRHPLLIGMSTDPILRGVKLIAEPWDLGSGGYQVGGFPSSWSEWNGRYRDCVRDFWRSQPSTLPEFASRLMGSSDLYQMNGRRPVASVNFITAHDGFTMNDLVSYNEKHNTANGEGNRDGESNNRSWNCGVEGPTTIKDVNDLRQQQMRNMFATLLLSQGIPMICGGDEVARAQQGNNNAYCQDNAISWTNWDLDDTQKDLFEFVAKLIHLRLEHPVLHRRRFFTGREPGDASSMIPQVEWMDHTGSIMDMDDWSNTHAFSVMIYLNGSDIPETDWYGNQMVDNDFILIFNAHYEPIMFTLPDEQYGKKWRLVIDTHNPKGPELNYEAGFAITAQSRSFLLLMSDKKPDKKVNEF